MFGIKPKDFDASISWFDEAKQILSFFWLSLLSFIFVSFIFDELFITRYPVLLSFTFVLLIIYEGIKIRFFYKK